MTDQEQEEKEIIMKALTMLHNLKYVPDVVIELQNLDDTLRMLVEEITVIRNALKNE